MKWWRNDESSGVWERVDAMLTRGDFGRGTWGLRFDVDGEEATVCIRAEYSNEAREKADEVLAKFAEGWRPTNWEVSE